MLQVYRRRGRPAIILSAREQKKYLLPAARKPVKPAVRHDSGFALMNQNKFQALLLGHDQQLAETLLSVMRLDGGALGVVNNDADALRFLQEHSLDIVFLDFKSAEAGSLKLLRQLKLDPLPLPVVTIALEPAGRSPAEMPVLLRAFELGLSEWIQTPFENGLFRARLGALAQFKRKLEELSRRQMELAGACRTAEANSRAKSDFLAAMSHEIRTPMNGVIAMTSLLMETSLTADQRGYLETIYNSSESLLNIINDILDFSKIEAGKMELERRRFDLRAGIEAALDLLAPRAQDKQLDLACEVDDTIPALVEGDEQRLRQVLVNLVGNALKFTERGEVFIRVEKLPPAAADANDPQALRLHFAVRDSGIGIQPDRLARLFRPFAQGDVSTARKYGGTGLGLVISRRLVELMGGRMWAESVTGDGSTFHFTIALTAPADSAPPAHTRPQPRLADLKILVLEDNVALRNLLLEQCRRWGMFPQAVENAAQAMALLRQGATFDLALVDAQLPGTDGAAVAKEMQQLPSSAMMPVVFLTALGKKSGGADDVHVMFAHTVSKPVKPAQLCAALERALLSPRLPSGKPEPAKAETTLAARLPLRVLLVDDNAINQKVAVRILQQLGYQPEVAANGREALVAIERQPVDLIFMDVMMPEMDGLEATCLIRKRQADGGHKHFQSRIVIVAMTAHAMQGDREKCLAAGMDDYLAKPIRPKDVREMIEKWGGKAAELDNAPRAAAETAEELPVDMSRVNDLTDGNVDSLRELMDMYLQQTQKQFLQLREAIRDGNADQVRRVAHSCAGASATLGMTRLVPKLRELEKLGAAGTLTGTGEICDHAAREFERIREFLKTKPELAGLVASLNPA
jgi:signal transduction histidine kinase/DNA-binding LytR/AlgR family response regulator